MNNLTPDEQSRYTFLQKKTINRFEDGPPLRTPNKMSSKFYLKKLNQAV